MLRVARKLGVTRAQRELIGQSRFAEFAMSQIRNLLNSFHVLDLWVYLILSTEHVGVHEKPLAFQAYGNTSQV